MQAAFSQVSVKSERKGDIVREEYSFTNHTDKHIFTRLTDIGIYATFNDDYEGARVCMTQRFLTISGAAEKFLT